MSYIRLPGHDFGQVLLMQMGSFGFEARQCTSMARVPLFLSNTLIGLGSRWLVLECYVGTSPASVCRDDESIVYIGQAKQLRCNHCLHCSPARLLLTVNTTRLGSSR